MDEVTVYFGNGKVTIDPQYKPQLLKLAQKAPSITGYVIQVKGYASAVGSAAVNQKLSQERADAVSAFMEAGSDSSDQHAGSGKWNSR